MPHHVSAYVPEEFKLPPKEFERRFKKIRFVGLARIHADEPVRLFYLEKRPVDYGLWLKKPEEPAFDLKLVATIETHHYYFTEGPDPSIGEYLSQIPQELVDKIDVVEVSKGRFANTGASWKLETRLYKKI